MGNNRCPTKRVDTLSYILLCLSMDVKSQQPAYQICRLHVDAGRGNPAPTGSAPAGKSES